MYMKELPHIRSIPNPLRQFLSQIIKNLQLKSSDKYNAAKGWLSLGLILRINLYEIYFFQI